jgi:UDP-N-acetylmuramate--alanine ligase
MLLDLGYTLSGSDLKLSATTNALAGRGVTVYEGQQAENLNNITLVVTTAAAGAENPELQEARRRGIPILTNAEMVGALLNRKRLLAIAGTHGKTTTTGLVAFLLEKAGLDPTYYIGGIPRDLGRAGKAGKGEFAVVEADEYTARFLNYRPEAAIITNIEADHLDYYGSFEALKEAFEKFALNVPNEGSLFFCADDAGSLELAKKVSRIGVFTYGLSPEADWQATDLKLNEIGGYSFNLNFQGHLRGTVTLGIPGVHNVRNAIGALAMVIKSEPSFPIQSFCDLASHYRGTGRRFELKGKFDGKLVVDDYAHHPTEIKATLAAARARYSDKRIVALFQPHTYSRTKALLEEFAGAFEDADVVALMEIFPARETDTLGVSSQDILDKMQHKGKYPQPLTHQNAANVLLEILKEGDVLLTLGAGDVYKVGEQVLAD